VKALENFAKTLMTCATWIAWPMQMMAHPSMQMMAHPSMQMMAHPSMQMMAHPSMQMMAHPSMQMMAHPQPSLSLELRVKRSQSVCPQRRPGATSQLAYLWREARQRTPLKIRPQSLDLGRTTRRSAMQRTANSEVEATSLREHVK
jgi:hypothetical protein